MQSNELTNDGCNGINGTITKNNTDDNCNMETKITMVNDNGTTGNNDASVPSTKVDVEPINNKDGVERNSERSCEGDDVVTSPPIKLRIRQSFHDGTLDDGINNGASTKATNDSVAKSTVESDASVKSDATINVGKSPVKANQPSSKEEKSAEVNDDDETKMDVDPEPEASVKSEDDKHLPDECIVMQKTNLPQEPPAVDSPNNDVESHVIRPTKTKGNIKKLMQKKRELDSPPVNQRQPSPPPTPGNVDGWKYSLGDLLWGKVSGHPWWPCLVAEDPFDKAYHKLAKRNRCKMYHVQYFGNEGERGWISENAALEFKGKAEFMTYCQKMISKNKKDRDKYTVKANRKSAWEFAVSSAMQALPMDPDDRIQNFAFVYTPIPTQVEKVKTSSKRPSSPVVLPASKRNKRCSSSGSSFDSNRDATQFSVFVRVRRNELFHQGVLNSIEEVGDTKDEDIMVKLREDWKDMHPSEKSRFIPMGVNSPVTVASSAKTPTKNESKPKTPKGTMVEKKFAKESKTKGRPRKEVIVD